VDLNGVWRKREKKMAAREAIQWDLCCASISIASHMCTRALLRLRRALTGRRQNDEQNRVIV